jgi:hypothetical protein
MTAKTMTKAGRWRGTSLKHQKRLLLVGTRVSGGIDKFYHMTFFHTLNISHISQIIKY